MGGAVSHLLGKFGSLNPNDELQANVSGRLERTGARAKKMMADLPEYARRRVTARLFVAAQV